ncbi:hypothetical protein P43SY_011706 [Pythium insidiosum]|uniref:Archease domain-containing protein n=1 Tax=Pythium insidiosum TaxID=114742 RepID=A0AAD5Q535_PYTIN|nr:hypothetical protein P43SY_011706 [Pythium insidiosum]
MMDSAPLPQRVRRSRARQGSNPTAVDAQTYKPETGGGNPQPTAERSATTAHEFPFEYLDHTADVQLHAWGNSLEEAFASVTLCMFNYMTDLRRVETAPTPVARVAVEGHDLLSLLYNFMDEFLFLFATEGAVCRTIDCLVLDTEAFRIEAVGHGETFDLTKHTRGTEVKAVTFSNMQILHRKEHARLEHEWEIFVIVDI